MARLSGKPSRLSPSARAKFYSGSSVSVAPKTSKVSRTSTYQKTTGYWKTEKSSGKTYYVSPKGTTTEVKKVGDVPKGEKVVYDQKELVEKVDEVEKVEPSVEKPSEVKDSSMAPPLRTEIYTSPKIVDKESGVVVQQASISSKDVVVGSKSSPEVQQPTSGLSTPSMFKKYGVGYYAEGVTSYDTLSIEDKQALEVSRQEGIALDRKKEIIKKLEAERDAEFRDKGWRKEGDTWIVGSGEEQEFEQISRRYQSQYEMASQVEDRRLSVEAQRAQEKLMKEEGYTLVDERVSTSEGVKGDVYYRKELKPTVIKGEFKESEAWLEKRKEYEKGGPVARTLGVGFAGSMYAYKRGEEFVAERVTKKYLPEKPPKFLKYGAVGVLPPVALVESQKLVLKGRGKLSEFTGLKPSPRLLKFEEKFYKPFLKTSDIVGSRAYKVVRDKPFMVPVSVGLGVVTGGVASGVASVGAKSATVVKGLGTAAIGAYGYFTYKDIKTQPTYEKKVGLLTERGLQLGAFLGGARIGGKLATRAGFVPSGKDYVPKVWGEKFKIIKGGKIVRGELVGGKEKVLASYVKAEIAGKGTPLVGVAGKKVFIGGRVPKSVRAGIARGSLPGEYPSLSPAQTKIFKTGLKGKAFRRVELFSQVKSGVGDVKSRFVQKRLPRGVEYMSREQAGVTYKFFKKHRFDLQQVYGSTTQKAQMRASTWEKYLGAKKPGDVDIQLWSKRVKAERLTKELVTQLNEVKGPKMRVSRTRPTLIETKYGRVKHHAVDIHSREQADIDIEVVGEQVFGTGFAQKPIKIEKLPSMRLGESFLRAGTSSFRYVKGQFGPKPHRMKDISKMFATGEDLVGSMKDAGKATQLRESLSALKKTYPKSVFKLRTPERPVIYVIKGGVKGVVSPIVKWQKFVDVEPGSVSLEVGGPSVSKSFFPFRFRSPSISRLPSRRVSSLSPDIRRVSPSLVSPSFSYPPSIPPSPPTSFVSRSVSRSSSVSVVSTPSPPSSPPISPPISSPSTPVRPFGFGFPIGNLQDFGVRKPKRVGKRKKPGATTLYQELRGIEPLSRGRLRRTFSGLEPVRGISKGLSMRMKL